MGWAVRCTAEDLASAPERSSLRDAGVIAPAVEVESNATVDAHYGIVLVIRAQTWLVETMHRSTRRRVGGFVAQDAGLERITLVFGLLCQPQQLAPLIFDRPLLAHFSTFALVRP